MSPLTCRGFTLIELIMAVAISAILLGVGIPSFQSFAQDSRVTSQTNEFVAAINTARSEAIKRSAPIGMCSSSDALTCAASNSWTSGWIIFTDSSGATGAIDATDTLLRAYAALGGNSTLSTAATNSIRYLPTGALGGTTVDFSLQTPDCVVDDNRQITVNRQGHARVQPQSC